MIKTLIVSSTYQQAVIIARQLGLDHREWKHCPDDQSLAGYGPENRFIQVEPLLANPGTVPFRRFFDALERLRILEHRGATIEVMDT